MKWDASSDGERRRRGNKYYANERAALGPLNGDRDSWLIEHATGRPLSSHDEQTTAFHDDDDAIDTIGCFTQSRPCIIIESSLARSFIH